MSRQTLFTEAVADEIIERLSNGEPLAEICRRPGMPRVSTVNDWRRTNEAFAERCANARDDGYDAIAADVLRIADTPCEGIIEKAERVVTLPPKDAPEGTEPTIEFVVTERRREDMLGHRKLQVETRLKLLSKWDPRRYGDKLEHTGPGGDKLFPDRVEFVVIDAKDGKPA